MIETSSEIVSLMCCQLEYISMQNSQCILCRSWTRVISNIILLSPSVLLLLYYMKSLTLRLQAHYILLPLRRSTTDPRFITNSNRLSTCTIFNTILCKSSRKFIRKDFNLISFIRKNIHLHHEENIFVHRDIPEKF